MDGDGSRSGFKKMKCGEFGEKGCEFEPGLRNDGELTKNVSTTLNLNANSNHLPVNGAPSCIQDSRNFVKPKSSGLDLNKEDVSVTFNNEPLHHYKNYERDALSECGSTCGSMAEKDPMAIWKQMKQNGFLSSSHGGVVVPSMPKPRARKKGNELVVKKKMEIAKREQVDRFAKVAAPSGLLNDLNPGIINHVRNRKQVHAIIENLVRSSRNKNRNIEPKQDDGTLNHSSGSQQTSFCWSADNGSGLTDREAYFRSKTSYHDSLPSKQREDDVLALKLSSASIMRSENISSLTNEESANISTVDSLSVKAASVASQWLELLHQDIQGRLAALKRSKKRVRDATEIELPFLISSELSSNQENDSSAVRITNTANNDMHKLRWTTLFDQMDKSLLEEEKNLEISLNQVREMLLHCENGLQFPPANSLQHMFPRAELTLDKDLAVRAAAAAIYSTSNFLQPAENQPCF
ncbi:hypothetical protein CTI12_AA109970 [Artemisia annua]|uniref:Uncharacterized protein n=1 Tax=Artemisia annua TaxID=35608 RepID=A0A2U1PUW4_ARTAN|nr:hypothetical protein CTI12_AA109970 [Artemisia annua]